MPVKFWVYLCSRSLHRFSQPHVSEAEAGPDPSGPVGSNTVRIRHVKVLHGSMWHLAVASLTNRKPQEPVLAFQKKCLTKYNNRKVEELLSVLLRRIGTLMLVWPYLSPRVAPPQLKRAMPDGHVWVLSSDTLCFNAIRCATISKLEHSVARWRQILDPWIVNCTDA